jgi:hypothetical protein
VISHCRILTFIITSLLELFRIIESRGINKNDILNVLTIINTGQVPFLQKKVANLTYGIECLENEIKKKEYNLSVLDNRTKELMYREVSMYPISSVYSAKALTYRADNVYPTFMDDSSIRPVSSNMKLMRRNDTYKSIDSLANEVIDAWADRKQIS